MIQAQQFIVRADKGCEEETYLLANGLTIRSRFREVDAAIHPAHMIGNTALTEHLASTPLHSNPMFASRYAFISAAPPSSHVHGLVAR
jgi:hypothetical protein